MKKRIFTLGDSTMQFNGCNKYPRAGWPQALELFVAENVEIHNFAKNGRSTKSYIDEGRFSIVLNEISENDLVLIQFGHNDQKIVDPARYTIANTTYKENLIYMVKKVQEKKAQVILLTSITERKFQNGELSYCHGEYPQAVKDTAKELGVPCIDLYELTRECVIAAGEEKSKKFFMNFEGGIYPNYPDGSDDDTHIRFDGAFMVASCFYEEMKKENLFQEFFVRG